MSGRPTIRVINESPVSNTAKVMINDQIIPVYSATIRMKVGNMTEVTLEVPADQVDVVALEEHTDVTIVKPEDAE